MANFVVSGTPHVRSKESIQSIMRDVIIALVPATAAGIYYFGMNALILVIAAIVSSVAFEAICQKVMKKPVTVSDLSAVVTGLLLAMNLPAAAPIWVAVVGSAFAIIFGKQLFGGLGQNFINPALAGRAFLLASYPTEMTTWSVPNGLEVADAATYATPLAQLKAGYLDASLGELMMGQCGGTIGETCAIALLVGFAYLVIRNVIQWYVPVSYIATVFVCYFLFGGFNATFALQHVLAGGLLLGAIFMATDYVTTPNTGKGRVVFCIGAGLLTFLIRQFGAYPEGVSLAILFMNLLTPYISAWTKTKTLGKVK